MVKSGLSYRTGWPQLPPLPFDTETSGAKNSIENAKHDTQTAEDIFEVQGIKYNNIFFAYRRPRNADPQDFQESYLTLMVTIDTLVTELSPLKQSIIKLRQHLKKRDATMDVAIEFIDHRAVHGILTLPIRHYDTEVLKCWDTVSEIVHSELSSQEGKDG
jgi:hypothetical protein